MSVPAYLPRILDRVLPRLLEGFPALLITGPRATGKTTTATHYAASTIRLDRAQEAAVVSADVDAVLARARVPVLVDEWQVVPSVLSAIKRAVDTDSTPGRFLITGSVRADLDHDVWPGTGRVVRIPMYGLTVSERIGSTAAGFVDRIVSEGTDAIVPPGEVPDLPGYIDEVLVSGFPQPALQMSVAQRELWLSSYIDQVVTRDADLVDRRRDPIRLRRFLEVLALNTAGVVTDHTLFAAAGINRHTADAYEELLVGLGIVAPLPAWWTNRLKRLVQRPKRQFVDAALAVAAMQLTAHDLLREGDLLGRILDTFVVSQLRAEQSGATQSYRLFHLRTEQGRHEVDLVVELPGSRIIAIEVKATSAPRRDDAKHLMWLRDQLEERFVAGVVFHTGAHPFRLDERIVAAPIAALWPDAAT